MNTETYDLDIVADISAAPREINLAEGVDSDTLSYIGHALWQAIEDDEESRAGWMGDNEEWIKLATQVRDTKSYPWNGASNMKYPLMTTACIQFHARALPGLINSERPVMCKVVGNDPEGKKLERSERVSRFMSYDILQLQDEWMDEMDRLLFVLPMVGLAYKKTFYSELDQRSKTSLLLPNELIVNYYATDPKRARMTHVLYMDENEVVERQRAGLYREFDEVTADISPIQQGEPLDGERDTVLGLRPGINEFDDEYRLYESHCFLDLDGDGYKEPYVVTLDSTSKQILRIVARFTEESLRFNDNGDVLSITPTDYFTKYILLPDPNSAMYGLGFGTLLGPTNESVNTLINQLIDAGTLSNLQSGFIGRGAKLKGGATRFRPGEWKIVNTTGDDLRKSIFPMPVRDPSPTLFSLLQMLIQAGQQITSVTDMMMGENPGQNQKATTTMAVLEQGMSVFKGIYKRLHRSLTKELEKLYTLNYLYLNEDMYHEVLDDIMPSQVQGPQGPQEVMMPQGSREDFNPKDMNVLPTADPSLISDAQRLMKAQSLLEKLQMGLPLNPMVVTQKVLQAEQHEDIQELMTLPDRGPSPEEKEFQLDVTRELRETIDSKFKALKIVAEAEALEEGTQMDMYRAVVDDTLKVWGAENEQKAGAVDAVAAKPKPSSKKV